MNKSFNYFLIKLLFQKFIERFVISTLRFLICFFIDKDSFSESKIF